MRRLPLDEAREHVFAMAKQLRDNARRTASSKKTKLREKDIRKLFDALAMLDESQDPPWTPFQLAEWEDKDKDLMEKSRGAKEEKVYLNSIYQVSVTILQPWENDKVIHWLSIKRRDKAAVHDWRHFQRIKNELVGEEYEAVEIYPAESRLVDSSNQYHLWVLPEGDRVGFGFGERLVMQIPDFEGARQRPIPKDFIRGHVSTPEEVKEKWHEYLHQKKA